MYLQENQLLTLSKICVVILHFQNSVFYVLNFEYLFTNENIL